MIRTDSRIRMLATCLAFLGGYVDALGFVALGGFFVSFMSGNSTRAGVGIAEGTMAAAIAASLIAAFVAGVVAGSIAGRFAGARRVPYALGLVTLLLVLAAICHEAGASRATFALMAMAMGAENTVFEREGEVSIGVTYMTGTLVKFGQRLTAALFGGERLAWLPYLLLWFGLVGGAALGAFAFPYLGLRGLWIAAAAAAALGLYGARIGQN